MKFKDIKADDVRIVATNQHHDSGEIEVVLEVTLPGKAAQLFRNQTILVSKWIDKMEVLEDCINEE